MPSRAHYCFHSWRLPTPLGLQPCGGARLRLTHQRTFGRLFVLLVFLFLFLFLVFLLNGPRSQPLLPLLDDQLSIVLITWMVPDGLTSVKVEIVNVTCDVLARSERVQKLVLSKVRQKHNSLKKAKY